MHLLSRKERLPFLFLILCLSFAFSSGVFAAGNQSPQGETYLTKKNLSMKLGQTKRLRLKGASGKVKWSSSNEEVATVTKGRVTAQGEGTCTITALNGGKRYVCTITVGSVSISHSDISLVKRRQIHLQINGYAGEPEWSTSRKSVAEVDQDGNVTGVEYGRCEITARCGDIVLSCSVRVVEPDHKTLHEFYKGVGAVKKSILLCGSSSFDQWRLAYDAFAPLNVTNMGVGGSTVAYWIKWRKQLVTSFKPAAVVVYIGSNDLAKKISGTKNAANTIRLLKLIRKELKSTPIFYVSVCPCWGRKSNWKSIKISNRKMKQYCNGARNMYYVDLASAFLDENGKPDRNLFKEDQIHPSKQGYEIWKKVVAEEVKQVLGTSPE